MAYLDYALIEKSTLGDIGDAIREKTGGISLIDPANFASEIKRIPSEVDKVPLQDKTVTENGEVTADEGYYGLGTVTVNIENNNSSILSDYAEPLCEYIRESINLATESSYYTKDNHPYLMMIFQERERYPSCIAIFSGIEVKEILTNTSQDSIAVAFNGNNGMSYFNNELYQSIDFYDFALLMNDIINNDYCSIKNNKFLASYSHSKEGGYTTPWIGLNTNAKIYTNFTTDVFDDYDNIEWLYFDDKYSLQSKTVTEKGEVIPDDGYYGLSKVIVDVEGGVGIDGGYVANFYDENEELIHTVVTRATIPVTEPEYDCGAWTDGVGGSYVKFPVLLTKDMDYYAVPVTTYASMLYAHFGVSKIDYPYILLRVDNNYSGDNPMQYIIGFSTTQHSVTETKYSVNAGLIVEHKYPTIIDNDMNTSVETVIQSTLIPQSFKGWNGLSKSNNITLYGNFENEYLDGRLDTPVEEETSPFYTVNFYDYDQELIETHTAKVGNLIGRPLSFNSTWRGADATVYTFPMTCEVGQIIDIYAYNETVAEKIYAHYNIDSSVYPYLTIYILNSSIYLTFSKSVNAVVSNQFETIDCYTCHAYGIGSAVNIDEIENVLYEKIGSEGLTYTSSLSWDSNMGAYYLNYGIPTSECSATVYELRR